MMLDSFPFRQLGSRGRSFWFRFRCHHMRSFQVLDSVRRQGDFGCVSGEGMDASLARGWMRLWRGDGCTRVLSVAARLMLANRWAKSVAVKHEPLVCGCRPIWPQCMRVSTNLAAMYNVPSFEPICPCSQYLD
ncbi:unnamed protein product [Ectocarpus sp. 12 AP-2014]